MHVLENEALCVEIADKGAELSRVWDKQLYCERLWGADAAVWNRHAPILFPFVGKVVDGKYRVNGREYTMKTQHGFARDLDFVCVEEAADTVCHVLCSTEQTRRIYPFDFRLFVRHRLDEKDPRRLHIEWRVCNDGQERMYYAIGGHPAFLPPEGVTKEACFLGVNADIPKSFSAWDASLSETWIFEDHQLSEVQLVRPDKSPWVTLHCEDFPILAVWANAVGPFICLEPWCGRTDDEGFAGELPEKVCQERLNPGESKKIAYDIEFHRG